MIVGTQLFPLRASARRALPKLLLAIAGLQLAACGAGEVPRDASIEDASSNATTGPLGISTPLTLGSSVVVQGQTLQASVTYKNPGATAVTIAALVITARPPGGTHSGGPYDDFSPAPKSVTIAAGASYTLTASRTFLATDALGTWEAYSTYKDSAGVWHDGPGVSFTVRAAYDGLHSAYPDAFVSPTGQRVRIIGFNVRSVVYPSTNWTYSADNFATVKANGFNTVRFALNWPDFEPTQGGFDSTAFALLGQAVANAKAAGLYVVLDPNHLKGSGNTPSWATGADTIAITETYALPYLKKVAAQFKDEPAVIAIDLTNEPWQKNLDQNRTFRMYQTLISGVRAVDPEKILVVEPTWGNSSIANADFSIFTNKHNLVMTLHDYYAGGDATGYSSTGLPIGNYVWDGTSGYPSPNVAQLEANLLVSLNALKPVQMPLYVGEYGLGDGVTNHDQWLRDMTSVLDKYNLPRTLWEWHSGGPMSATSGYTYKSWVPLLLQ